jgi:predicted DNA repair protein MutK
MFLVGGGILSHGIPWIDHWIKGIVHRDGLSRLEAVLAAVTPILANLAVGVVAGAIAMVIVGLGRRMWPGKAHA